VLDEQVEQPLAGNGIFRQSQRACDEPAVPRQGGMLADEAPPAIGHVLCGSLFELGGVGVARIEEAQVIARQAQRGSGALPSIDAANRARRHLDATRQAARDEGTVGERQVLRQRERTIPLARGREDDRVSALGQQLDDAVEVAGLGNVVEEEKDADDPYLIITPLDMLQLSPRTAANGMGCLAAAAGAFAATLAWRFLTFTGFTNDHYAHLALAQQWLLGDRPVRDFTDPGWPLTYLLSAAAWRVAGEAMWVEWTLTATALALAAACTVIAAHRLSGSLTIALVVTAFEIVIYPRTYSYPKIVAYAAAACVMAALAARPSRGRILLMAAVIAAAFLLRHDHGLYIGVASAVCLAVRNPRDGLTPGLRRISELTAATAAFLLPWIVFVTLNGGLPAYFETALEFARAEANASNLRSWPRLTLVPGQPLIGLTPPDRPLVQIQWRPDTDEALRHTLEGRYGLEFVRDGDEAVFYRVIDTSAANLETLGDDP